MGTFILKPLTVFTVNGAWTATIATINIPSPTNPQLVQAATTAPVHDTNYVQMADADGDISFTAQGLALYLDGSLTPIETNNLPPGFQVTDANYLVTMEIFNSGVMRAYKNSVLMATKNTSSEEDFVVPLGAITNLDLQTASFQLEVDAVALDGGRAGELWIEGSYTGGPLSISPSGGSVEPGQYATVTGEGAGSLEYAATNGDQVIPIVPKVIGPNEVEIEIPSPDPACEDCFDDCPECDECFDVCNEDLTGEACQACMDACLDCLVNCLEDQEAGEDCQAAVNDPADPTPIVIICGTPGTQFNGSVPLGNFNILVARASGIYQLVDGKEEDTLYATARDGTTYDVKIPNPNAKSGFFRS